MEPTCPVWSREQSPARPCCCASAATTVPPATRRACRPALHIAPSAHHRPAGPPRKAYTLLLPLWYRHPEATATLLARAYLSSVLWSSRFWRRGASTCASPPQLTQCCAMRTRPSPNTTCASRNTGLPPHRRRRRRPALPPGLVAARSSTSSPLAPTGTCANGAAPRPQPGRSSGCASVPPPTKTTSWARVVRRHQPASATWTSSPRWCCKPRARPSARWCRLASAHVRADSH
jgi:hypothetical protein